MIPQFYFHKISENLLSDTSTTNNQLDKEIKIAFMSVINSQAELINKLIVNQTYLKKLLYLKSESASEFLNDIKLNDSHQFLNSKTSQKIQKLQQANQEQLEQKSKSKIWKKNKKREQFQSEVSQHDTSNYNGFEFKASKFTETKNIIKNFSKALFRFIQKFRVYVRLVLQRQKISEQKFHSVLLRLKNKIFTMSKLRELWLPEGNECHKIFRIISLQYIRKHSLNHIFYSRVVNYKIHNKYRRRFYEILKSPQEFTNLKIN